MNAKEAAARSGTSVRALRYYEENGLIHPARRDNDYRDYSESDVARARLIRAYRELGFSVPDMRRLLDAPRLERDEMLEEHIRVLQDRRQRIDNRIALASAVIMVGPERLGEIDMKTLDEQVSVAQRKLDQDEDFRALSERYKKESAEKVQAMEDGLLEHLAAVGGQDGEKHIPALRAFVEEYFYPCTDDILRVYARSFGGDGLLARMLDERYGEGTSVRMRRCIESCVGAKMGV